MVPVAAASVAFPLPAAERRARVRAGVEEVEASLAQLGALQDDSGAPSAQRAAALYLRGKALDSFAEFRKEAEEALARAVKLDPSLTSAWCALAHQYWKKDDLGSASNCLTSAISAADDHEALCMLSTIERQQGQTQQDPVERLAAVERALTYAKRALKCDVKDGRGWAALGTAFLTKHFLVGGGDTEMLEQAVRAYRQAEASPQAATDPDMHFNRGMVFRFLELHRDALEAFTRAASLDPELPAEDSAEALLTLLRHCKTLIENKCRTKPKRLKELAKDLEGQKAPSSKFFADLESAALSELAYGPNADKWMALKCLEQVTHGAGAPLYYIMSDKKGECLALSVYGVRDGVIRSGQTLCLARPRLHAATQKLEWKGEELSFAAVRVGDARRDLLVGGRRIGEDEMALATRLTSVCGKGK
eukprot:PRCOL_00002109-RA